MATNSQDSAFGFTGMLVKEKIYEAGLSKREYLAAMAMQGILANSEIAKNNRNLNIEEAALKFADSLIIELNKEK